METTNKYKRIENILQNFEKELVYLDDTTDNVFLFANVRRRTAF